MVIAVARERLGWESATTTEADEDTPYPVIALLDEQRNVTQMGGTMRLGRYPCYLQPETLAWSLYDDAVALERHRHRWEFNPRYRERLEAAGLFASGVSQDWGAGGDLRGSRPPLHARFAIPPRTAFASGPPASALSGLHR